MKKTLDDSKIDWMRRLDWVSNIHLVEPRNQRMRRDTALQTSIEMVGRGELTVQEIPAKVKELETSTVDTSPEVAEELTSKIKETVDAMKKVAEAEKARDVVAEELWQVCEKWGSFLHYLGAERDYMLEVRRRDGKEGTPVYTPTLSPVTEKTKRGRRRKDSNIPESIEMEEVDDRPRLKPIDLDAEQQPKKIRRAR